MLLFVCQLVDLVFQAKDTPIFIPVNDFLLQSYKFGIHYSAC